MCSLFSSNETWKCVGTRAPAFSDTACSLFPYNDLDVSSSERPSCALRVPGEHAWPLDGIYRSNDPTQVHVVRRMRAILNRFAKSFAGACRSQSPLEKRRSPRCLKPETPHRLPVKTPNIAHEKATRRTIALRQEDFTVSQFVRACDHNGRRRQSRLRGRGRQGQPEERKAHFARMFDMPQKKERLRFVSIIDPCK